MAFTRENLTSGLLIVLTALAGSALYFYGNASFNQVMIICQFVILIILAAMNGIFCNRFVLLVLALNVASLIITMSFHRAFGVSIVFMNLLLACFVFNNIVVSKRTYMAMHLIAAVLWTAIAVMAVHGSYTTVAGEWHSYKFFSVTYHKNTYAIVILGCAFHWLSVFETIKFRRITRNLLAIPLLSVAGWLIINSECRSVMMSIGLFTVLYFCVSNGLQQKWFYIIITTGIVLTGLFTIYYVFNVVELDLGDVMGHTSFNRLETWKAAFQLIRNYPMFGSGTDIRMAGYDSAHSTVLSILKTVGFIPLLSYIFCFGLRMQKCGNDVKRLSQIAMITALLVTTFESFYVESFIGMTFLAMLIGVKCSRDTEADKSCNTMVA